MSSHETIKSVLLVEDDEHTRRRLKHAIDAHPRLSVCNTCSTLESGLHAISEDNPDVLVTDLGLPDGSGIDLIRKARELNISIEIMVISVFGDERNVLAAIEAGASGYLLKDDDTGDIGNAITRLLAGESPISAAIARHLLRRFCSMNRNDTRKTDQQKNHAQKLTERETEVLQCMAKGYTYHEAADLLGMSCHTINSHIKRIYRKLEVNSRSEAVFEAVQLGLVEI